MAAARMKVKARPKSKSKAKVRAARKSAKPAIKRPRHSTEAKAPLAEMDAAWQSLLETALERHRAENAASPARSKPAKKK